MKPQNIYRCACVYVCVCVCVLAFLLFQYPMYTTALSWCTQQWLGWAYITLSEVHVPVPWVTVLLMSAVLQMGFWNSGRRLIGWGEALNLGGGRPGGACRWEECSNISHPRCVYFGGRGGRHQENNRIGKSLPLINFPEPWVSLL